MELYASGGNKEHIDLYIVLLLLLYDIVGIGCLGEKRKFLYIERSYASGEWGCWTGGRHPTLRSPYIGASPPSPQSYVLSLQHILTFSSSSHVVNLTLVRIEVHAKSSTKVVYLEI